jgi:hypothetical protein
MALPSSLKVALKEWAVVCRALEHGRQIILLRKGGIYEAAGEFEVEHRHFLLFPTYLHQNRAMIKPADQAHLEERRDEPAQITLSAAAEVTDIIELKSRKQMDRIDGEHLWTSPLVDMRFNYRPENPLYLMVVRTYRLTEARTIVNTPAYAGCKSWVPLEHDILIDASTPALDDRAYQKSREQILTALSEPDNA